MKLSGASWSYEGARQFFCLVLVAGALSGQDEVLPENLPLVRPLRGTVRIWRPGKNTTEAVKTEIKVAKHDRLGTADGEFAAFSTLGDTVISLRGVQAGSDRGLTLERSAARLVMKIHEGKLVVESFEAEILVETAQGRVEGKAAYFLVEVKENKTRVVAIDGTLTFSNSIGAVTLQPDQESSAEKGAKPTPPKTVDALPESQESDGAISPVNLIRNAGFEEGLKGWRADKLQPQPRAVIDQTVFHSGKRSARLDVTNATRDVPKSNWLGFTQPVTLIPGRRYFLRAYFRTETRQGSIDPFLIIGDDKEIGVARGLGAAEKKWILKRLIFTPKSADCGVSVQSEIQTERFDCTIWVDDFYLGELSDAPKEKAK